MALHHSPDGTPLLTADVAAVADREVAVLGFGPVAEACALNLRDSGVDVRIGLSSGGRARRRAEAEGFSVLAPEQAAADAEVLWLPAELGEDTIRDLVVASAPLVPDGGAIVTGAPEVLRYQVPAVPSGVDLVLVHLVATGGVLRDEFVDGRGVPAVLAVSQDGSGAGWEVAGACAVAAGAAPQGLMAVTPASLAEARELARRGIQAPVATLLRHGYESLVDGGYPPEIAYLTVVHGLKEMIDQLYVGGLGRHSSAGSDSGMELAVAPGVLGEQPDRALAQALAEVHRADRTARGELPCTELDEAVPWLRGLMSWIRG